MRDMTKPRKKKYELSDLTNAKQKEVAKILKPIIDSSGLTMRKFADLEPKISLTTLTSIFSPEYNGVPTPRILKLLSIKAANTVDKLSAEDVYADLMSAADYNIFDYPFKQAEKHPIIIAEDSILLSFVTTISELPIKGVIDKRHVFRKKTTKPGSTSTMYYYHDLTMDYTVSKDAPIDYWALDVCIGVPSKNILRNFFFMMLNDGTNERVKYSVITDLQEIYDEMTSMNIPALNLYISVILYKEDTFTETYLSTGINPSVLNSAGLSL